MMVICYACSLRKEKSPKVSKTLVPSSPAMIRALEVNSSLGDEFPSCIKRMVKSQVICGFWMVIPLISNTDLPAEFYLIMNHDKTRYPLLVCRAYLFTSASHIYQTLVYLCLKMKTESNGKSNILVTNLELVLVGKNLPSDTI